MQNENLRVGLRPLCPLFKVQNTENMCIRWMYLSNFRGSFMMSDLNARYLFNCVFFGVFFHQNYRCFCGLLKLVRRIDYCEPWKAGITLLLHFFSAYEFFSWFVLIRSICSCFFFTLFGLQSSTVYSEACKMQNLFQTWLSSSTPSILYTWLVFNCYFWCEFLLLASFFKVVSRKD